MYFRNILFFFGIAWLIYLPPAHARKFPHIQTSTLTYSASELTAGSFLGRHYDLLINPQPQLLSIARNEDPGIKAIAYLTLSSYLGNDSDLVVQFCTEHGLDDSLFYLWTDDTITIAGVYAGNPAMTTYPGEKVRFYSWNSLRQTPDFRNPEIGRFWWFKMKERINNQGIAYNGFMEDEATYFKSVDWGISSNQVTFPWHPNKWLTPGTSPQNLGWDGYDQVNIAELVEIADSLIYLKQHYWLSPLADSLAAYDLLMFRNPAAYFGMSGPYAPGDCETDCYVNARTLGNILGECCYLKPLDAPRNLSYLQYTRAMVDSGVPTILWVLIYSSDSLALGSWARCQMERLCYYYMAADPNLTWFNLSGNESWLPPNDFQADDSLYKWFGAIEHDIGLPLGDMYEAETGTDPVGQSYIIRARNYSKAIVLWRKQEGTVSYGDTSAVSGNLGGQYRELYADGSLGPITTIASLRNCEGKIYIPVTAIEQTGLEFDTRSTGVRVSPNPGRPAPGNQKICFRDLPDHSRLRLIDIAGKIIMEVEGLGAGDMDLSLEIPAAGVYFYIIESPAGSFRGKIVVVR